MGKNIYPQYGTLRRSKIRKEPIDRWLEDEEIDADLGELSNMICRNRLECRDSHRVFAQLDDFALCREVLASLRNGRMVRRAIIDILDIRRRAESDLGSRKREGGFQY